jgi:hypothetical protein
MTSSPEHSDEWSWAADRALWRRCLAAEASVDEPLRFIDLAAFAEGGLDPDEHDRVAALLHNDPGAAADVAAARALRDNLADLEKDPALIDRIVARVIALRRTGSDRGRVIPFHGFGRHIPLRGLARWGSLAAAIAIAAWLGFTMGSDASLALLRPGLTNQDATVIELLDPTTGFLHDLPAGVQT